MIEFPPQSHPGCRGTVVKLAYASIPAFNETLAKLNPKPWQLPGQ